MALPAIPARAAGDNAFSLRDDEGKRLANFRLASELSPANLPGIVWTGSETPDATLVEFFDYNCTWCRKAASDLDAMIGRDTTLRLGLVNYAVFGIGSIQAAKVQQAVLKLHGPAKAYAFHRAMFARRGTNDGNSAMQVVASLSLDKAAIETTANGEDITKVLVQQTKRAEAIGFNATPSFALNGVGLLGYPGPKTIGAMLKSVRACERVMCS